MALNQNLSFGDLTPEYQMAFRGRFAIRKMLLTGSEVLYKFTDRTLHDSKTGRVSPWWFSVRPLCAGDPGLEGVHKRAAILRCHPNQFARARAGVAQHGNTMTNLVQTRLKEHTYALVGQCASMPVEDYPLTPTEKHLSTLVFIGGAWQLYIPNLTRENVERVEGA